MSKIESIKYLENPDPASLGSTPEEFLSRLEGPCAFRIFGQDRSRTRALCTLLHGNEPSGLHAVFDYLKSGKTPHCDILFLIASVQAAQEKPTFSHRMLSGHRDLNRCFKPPYDDAQGALAESILRLLEESKPECLIDMHNTSGSGPAFGVSITQDADHIALTALFTNDLIVTDLRLGALMELSERKVPTVTIECGGARDPSSHIIAHEGLERFVSNPEVLAIKGESYPVNVYHNPIRLEVRDNAKVAYADEAAADAAITLPSRAEKFNYGTVMSGERIAFLGNSGLKALTAKDHHGVEHLEQFFEDKEGELYARHPLKVFMVTTNSLIAETDCLFYFLGSQCESGQ